MILYHFKTERHDVYDVMDHGLIYWFQIAASLMKHTQIYSSVLLNGRESMYHETMYHLNMIGWGNFA